MVKAFEMSNKQDKDGMRDVKIVLHEIYPESTFNVDGNGEQTNRNGIAWREKWVNENMHSLINKSIRVEYLDKSEGEINGHGFTGFGEAGDTPHFEDATVVGHFTDAQIQDIEYDDGVTRRVLVGIGVVDAMSDPVLVEKLEEAMENGYVVHGSVEIMHDSEHESIIYENDNGNYDLQKSRTPQRYVYSGYALLSVKEADPSAILLEINELEGKQMTEQEIKDLVAQTVAEISSSDAQIQACKDELEAKVAAANEATAAAVAEKEEIIASAEKIQMALDEARKELDEMYKKEGQLYEELEVLRKALAEAKAKERIGEMNAAIADFTDDEKSYAQAEIDAFVADPTTCEINSVVNKIWEGIGKSAKAAEKIVAEQNATNSVVAEDIITGIEVPATATEDVSIF